MATSHKRMLIAKELARELGRHPSYVTWMKRDGFQMRGKVATVEEARRWLTRHPNPRRRRR